MIWGRGKPLAAFQPKILSQDVERGESPSTKKVYHNIYKEDEAFCNKLSMSQGEGEKSFNKKL